MMEFETYVLPNGIRGVHRQIKSQVAHCALVVNAGTRDERGDAEWGAAHFAEHSFFKGTERRKAWQINCRLENVGGELNAFTTKEDTTVHATVLRGDFARAVELLGDVVFYSALPSNELIRERAVIVDEIGSYEDAPAESIYDTFEERLLTGSELGHNILGTRKSVRGMTPARIRGFLGRAYTTDQIVFSSIGSFSTTAAARLAERHFGSIPCSTRGFERILPPACAPFDTVENHRTAQIHSLTGVRTAGLMDERRFAISLLLNLLGGPSANSLLSTLLREKNGLSYTVEAAYTPYADCGVATIYFSSDPANEARCRELIDGLLLDLRSEKLPARRTALAKKQFIAQMTIAMESAESYMFGAGKALAATGQLETLAAAQARIEALSAEDLRTAAEIFAEPSRLTYR